MSMHDIEDLVEDTTWLVDRSSNYDLMAKRDLLYNLYKLMALFDTGYTHFRVMDILLKNHFVYKINIADYPQLDITHKQLPPDGNSGWVKDADEQTTLAYATNKNSLVHLYCDAGDKFWKRLCKLNIIPPEDQHPPKEMPIVSTITMLMRESETQAESQLLKQWYNLFANAVLQGDFGSQEGIPQTFNDLLADPAFAELRVIAQRNQLENQKKRKREDDYLAFPGLKYELYMATDIGKIAVIRYLLELSSSTEKILASYQKARLAIEKGPEKIKLIHKTLNAGLEPMGWQYVEAEPEKGWIWYKDLADTKYQGPGHRLFIMLELDVKEKTLSCRQALQHSLILKWQQKQPSLMPPDWHFYYELAGWMPDGFSEKNKHLSMWQGWKFDINQSEKVLLGHLENLITVLKSPDNNYFDFVLNEFPEKFAMQDPQKILHLLDEGEGELGCVPQHVLFDSKTTTLIAFASIYFDQGDLEKTREMIELIKNDSETQPAGSSQKRLIIDPLLRHWQENNAILFPPVWHYYYVKEIRKLTDAENK